jgi:hypothetical protein
LFRDRFLESESVSQGASFDTNIYQVVGLLAVPGLLTVIFSGEFFEHLARLAPGPELDWALRLQRTFFPTYSLAIVGFATIFEWNRLFPDRRDFLLLAPFPIRLRDLFGAKLASLGWFLLALTVAVNGFQMVCIPLFSFVIPEVRAAGFPGVMFAQVAASVCASAFGFVGVLAFQGVLINVVSVRIFRQISPWIQMAGMSLMVILLITSALSAGLMRPIAESHTQWLYYFPPYWFAGVYDLVLPHPDPLFASLGLFAIKALGTTIVVFGLAWATGFRRHFRRTLEAEDSQERHPDFAMPEYIFASPAERGIYGFSGSTIARSTKHRLFVATYLSFGIALGLLSTFVVHDGQIGLSPQGLRSFPLLVVFFAVSGLRAAFLFPAELPSNWLFQITEDSWSEASRRASRKRVLASCLLPTLFLFAPVEAVAWGWRIELFHFAFQISTGALLVEALFWNFDKVPFTCSCLSGKVNLAVLAGLYLFGFTSYSFQMADLEAWLEGRTTYAIVFVAFSFAALGFLWRRRPVSSAVQFVEVGREIQTLDLT